MRFGVAIVFVLASGCASYTTHISPAPTPKGELRMGVNAGALSLDRGPSRQYLPSLEMTVRYGLSERVDIGGKANLLGAELNTKVVLREGDTSIAVVPGTGLGVGALGSDTQETFYVSFGAPVLFGFTFGDTQVVTGVKTLVQAASGDRVSTTTTTRRTGDLVLLPGTLLGVRFRLTDTVVLFPEVDVHVGYDVDREAWQDPVFQASIGVQFAVDP